MSNLYKNTTTEEEEVARATGVNPFAKSGIQRSPTHQQRGSATTTATPKSSETVNALDLLRKTSSRTMQTPLGKVGKSKQLVDSLHEFVGSKNNVHKDIKDQVIALRSSLFDAVADWNRLAEKNTAMECELAELRDELKQLRESCVMKPLTQDACTSTESVPKLAKSLGENFGGTPKRPRQSPGEGVPGGSKRQKNSKKAVSTAAQGPSRAPLAVDDSDALADAVAGDDNAPWTKVAGKRSKVRNTAEPKRPRSKRMKSDALIVKVEEGMKYSDVLRSLRENDKLKELGSDVRNIRRTRAGDMILVLKKDAANSSVSYQTATKEALGEKVEIRALCPTVTLQCKGLDLITTEEEVTDALVAQCNIGKVEASIKLRRGPMETQIATIKLPVEAADKALRIGKVKVGWSVCPLSIPQTPEMCFRCLAYGHKSWACKGPDRSKLCRRCGASGHKAKECEALPNCLLCTAEEGNKHVTGGPRCWALKRAVAKKL